MGEVFSAIDTRVDRKVAVKVLPVEFSRDPDRLRRFQLEARTLATLNHPNVALLFGFERTAQNLLVLELVEGETLADRLRRGPLPLEEALQIAVKLPLASKRRTPKASSIAISSRRISRSLLTVTPKCSISVWPSSPLQRPPPLQRLSPIRQRFSLAAPFRA